MTKINNDSIKPARDTKKDGSDLVAAPYGSENPAPTGGAINPQAFEPTIPDGGGSEALRLGTGREMQAFLMRHGLIAQPPEALPGERGRK
ncbi:MAG: hypothetical protein WAW63_02990 [Candidatus Saccharimonadales bacterium]|jgi:hypothetical protein|nr:hypothetical protein [Candidatus Saccharibacteria bacterium]